jgi:flagellar M-ring protein FliF
MNEFLQRVINQIKELWGRWSRTQKIILFSVLGVTILAIILLAAFTSRPSMVPLISTPITDEATLNRIVLKLDEEIPGQFEVRSDNVILVSDERTKRRMIGVLSREDLIPEETDPWAIIDIDRWTLTDFERKVNLRRAITDRLEQFVEALDFVDAAEVIIDLPEEALFVEDQKDYTASIQITPKPGFEDDPGKRKKIEGIQRLVKLSVSGLKDENIVITDHTGTILNDFEGLAELDRLELTRRELEQKRRLEQDYKREILASLRQFYATDRVEILKLEIDLDTSKQSSETKEHFPITMTPDNPGTPYDESERIASTPISSEQRERHWEGTGINPEGPPGQEGQTPPDYKDLSNLVGKLDEKSSIVNQAVNERLTSREERPWDIKRITAGIAIDGVWEWRYDEKGELIVNPDGSISREYLPVSDEELRKVESLVKGSVGFSQERGDVVTLEHLQKDRRAQFREEDELYRKRQQTRQIVLWVVVGLAVILAMAIVGRMLAKYMERKRLEREEELARQHQAMREAALRSAEEAGEEVELSIEERARQEMQENAINMAREHPEDVAQLIRTWLMEE